MQKVMKTESGKRIVQSIFAFWHSNYSYWEWESPSGTGKRTGPSVEGNSLDGLEEVITGATESSTVAGKFALIFSPLFFRSSGLCQIRRYNERNMPAAWASVFLHLFRSHMPKHRRPMRASCVLHGGTWEAALADVAFSQKSEYFLHTVKRRNEKMSIWNPNPDLFLNYYS